MNEIKSEFNGLNEDDITKVIDLLGADFGDAGKICEVSFFDSSGMPVKITANNIADSENKTDIKLSTASDFRGEIENNAQKWDMGDFWEK